MPIISTVPIPAPVFPNPRQVLPPISTGKSPHTSASSVTNLLPLSSTGAPFPGPLCSDTPGVLPPIFKSGSSSTPVWSSVSYGLPPVCTSVCLLPPCSTQSPSITAPSQQENVLDMRFSPEASPLSTPDVADFFTTPPLSNNPSTRQQISQIHQNTIQHTQLLNRIIDLLLGTRCSTSIPASEPEATPCPNEGATAQELPASIISNAQINELKNAATSRANFSMKLVKFIFTNEELQNRNVNGGHGRWALDPEKLQQVKQIYFKVYPCEDKTTEWKQCVDAINSHLR